MLSYEVHVDALANTPYDAPVGVLCLAPHPDAVLAAPGGMSEDTVTPPVLLCAEPDAFMSPEGELEPAPDEHKSSFSAFRARRRFRIAAWTVSPVGMRRLATYPGKTSLSQKCEC